MVSPALLVPAYAIAVLSTRSADDGCPSARQVSDALALRIPGVIAPASRPLPAGVLELELDPGAATVRFALRDHTGEVRLRRELAAAPECAALADTIGLIVDRFLQDIGYLGPPAPLPLLPSEPRKNSEPPPPAPPLPRTLGGAQIHLGLRASAEQDALFEIGVGASLRQVRWFEQLEVGYVPEQRAVQGIVGEEASLWRIPLRLSLFHVRSAGPGFLEPGVGLGLDLLQARMTRRDAQSSSFRISPSLQGVVGYRLTLAPGWFVRLEAAAVLNLVRYEFVAGWDRNLFPDARFYARMALALVRLF